MREDMERAEAERVERQRRVAEVVSQMVLGGDW